MRAASRRHPNQWRHIVHTYPHGVYPLCQITSQPPANANIAKVVDDIAKDIPFFELSHVLNVAMVGLGEHLERFAHKVFSTEIARFQRQMDGVASTVGIAPRHAGVDLRANLHVGDAKCLRAST